MLGSSSAPKYCTGNSPAGQQKPKKTCSCSFSHVALQLRIAFSLEMLGKDLFFPKWFATTESTGGGGGGLLHVIVRKDYFNSLTFSYGHAGSSLCRCSHSSLRFASRLSAIHSNCSKDFLLQCGFQLDAKKQRGKTRNMPIILASKPQMIVHSCWQNETLLQTLKYLIE